MQEAIAPQLAAWESFYVIVGSSAAALTGLQFVVMALVADSERRSSMREVSAFGTPTVVHFCAALFVAAILSAPWHSLHSAGIGIGICGAAGVIYSFLVFHRARSQTGYRPVLEDWVWTRCCRRSAMGRWPLPPSCSAIIPRSHSSSSAPQRYC